MHIVLVHIFLERCKAVTPQRSPPLPKKSMENFKKANM